MQLYHYAGNNPIKYVDPTGMLTLIINAPGKTTLNLENKLDRMETRSQKAMEKGKPTDVIVISPESGSVSDLVDAFSSVDIDPSELDDIVVAGGHGSEGFARVGGMQAEDVKDALDILGVELERDTQLYLSTCHQGNASNKTEWAEETGLSEDNIHGIDGFSWSNSSKDFVDAANRGSDLGNAWVQKKDYDYTRNGAQQ